MMQKTKRIGILGGTFNPIHLGHLVLAEQSKALLGLEKIILVPANLPAHKSKRRLLSANQRYHMVALAVKSNPDFEISDLELKRGGTSYSVETVKKFQSIFSCARLYFLVGSDFLKEFFTWKEFDKLSKICQFVIAQRPGHSFKRLPRNMQTIRISALDISSTDIRKRIRNRRSIRYLVPEAVRKYILKRKLYR